MPEHTAGAHEQLQEMIHEMIRILNRRGYENLATAGGEVPEDTYHIVWEGTEQSFMPDITAVKDGREYLFAVETAGTLRNPVTQDKIELFTEYARATGKYFGLIVPAEVRDEARALVEKIASEPGCVHVIGF